MIELFLDENDHVTDDEKILLRKYFNKEKLSASETKLIEENLKNSPFFNRAFRKGEETALALRMALQKHEDEKNGNEKKKDASGGSSKIYSLLIRAVIAITLLGGVASAVYMCNDTIEESSSPEVFAEQYFCCEAFPFKLPVTGETNPNSAFPPLYTIDPEIADLYNNEQYTEFLSEIESISNERAKQDLMIYEGISLAKISKEDESIAIFNSIIQKGGKFKPHAQWYLAEINIRNGSIEEAKNLLREVVKSGSYKSESATLLLRDL